MSLDQFSHNIFFDLFFRICLQVNPYPRLRKLRCRGIRAVCPIHKRDFELSSVKFVGDDDAVTVSFQGSLSLGDEQSIVRFQLKLKNDSATDVASSC
jgi:hypothetical protein